MVQRRHSILLDATAKAIAHYEVRALSKLFHESWDVSKIIAIIGIAHDNELAPSRRNPAHQGISVTACRHMRDACAQPFSDLDRAVGAAVIGDDHLSRNIRIAQCPLSFSD